MTNHPKAIQLLTTIREVIDNHRGSLKATLRAVDRRLGRAYPIASKAAGKREALALTEFINSKARLTGLEAMGLMGRLGAIQRATGVPAAAIHLS